jgi:ABC-type sugar transport system permease subunit
MRRPASVAHHDARLARMLVAPAMTLLVFVALIPIVATGWESLHGHDLRLPWTGRPFIGLSNFAEAVRDPRFLEAVRHTVLFALISVPIELCFGLGLALIMNAAVRGRALIRVTALLPWTIPTVVAALVWRFMFDGQAGVIATGLSTLGVTDGTFDWFVHPFAAWVPVVAADVWKTTPFVAILLLAGLQTIDPTLDDAARIDGAGPLRRFLTITLPLLRSAIVVAAAFRMFDALRLFDLTYVMTGGGPGTATESLSLYAFVALMQRLRFGYGAALSISVFVVTFVFALIWVRTMGRSLVHEGA